MHIFCLHCISLIKWNLRSNSFILSFHLRVHFFLVNWLHLYFLEYLPWFCPCKCRYICVSTTHEILYTSLWHANFFALYLLQLWMPWYLFEIKHLQKLMSLMIAWNFHEIEFLSPGIKITVKLNKKEFDMFLSKS